MEQFDPVKHPRGGHGRFAHVASGDVAAKRKATGTNTVAGVFVGGGKVHQPSEIPSTPLKRPAGPVKMDLAWPTRASHPKLMDRDRQQGFVTAQYRGALGRKGLNTSKDSPASVSEIAAHFGISPGEAETTLTELEARGVVYGNKNRGYWENKALGSGRRG
jgi:hypothetical protein